MNAERGSREGWTLCRIINTGAVDCPDLIPLDVHASRLGEVIAEAFDGWGGRRVTGEPSVATDGEGWRRAAQWLLMAGGLKALSFDLFTQPSFTCGDAMAYEEAQNQMHEWYAVDLSRLQYVSNAVEQIARTVSLPRARPGFLGWSNRATLLLKERKVETPVHFQCVACHLRSHVSKDPAFIDLSDRYFQENDSRAENGTMLAVGNQLRHYPAHGDVHIPETDPGRTQLPPTLHAPRLAIRGLLLTVQMLLVAAAETLPESASSDLLYGEWADEFEDLPILEWLREMHVGSPDLEPGQGAQAAGNHHECHYSGQALRVGAPVSP